MTILALGVGDELLYKYLCRTIDTHSAAGGYVTPNRIARAHDAREYLAVPVSPVARIEVEAKVLAGRLGSFGKCGNTILKGLARRAWPAFGLHGGAWELKVAAGQELKISSSSVAGWLPVEPSLTPEIPEVNRGAFLLESLWATQFQIAIQALADRILTALRNSARENGLEQVGEEDGGAVKLVEGLLGAAAYFPMPGSDFQYCVSFLHCPKLNDQYLGEILLFGSVWRDIEGPSVSGPMRSAADFYVAVPWAHSTAQVLPLGHFAERGIAHEISRKLKLPVPLPMPFKSNSPSLGTDNDFAVDSVVRSMFKSLWSAVRGLPTSLSSKRLVVPLPSFGMVGEVLLASSED